MVGVGLPPDAAAQGFSAHVGRLFDGEGWTAFRAAWTEPLAGPIGADLGAIYLRQPGSTARLFGLAADAALFRGGRPGAYLVAGASGGFGTGAADNWWRSWSAGVGYELLPASVLSLGIEGRYRKLHPSNREGAEFTIRLGTTFGAARTEREAPRMGRAAGIDSVSFSPEPAGRPALATGGVLGGRSTRADAVAPDSGGVAPTEDDVAVADVIRIAEGEIGTRYQLGGTGAAGDGFDCSGLIQYAYARVGITLPRRSADQAREGQEVGRDRDDLRPGDILTFSASGGGRVTHVGLYMGDGRFIHSASRGVQVSRLHEDDPNGRWWLRRWIGSRRIIQPD